MQRQASHRAISLETAGREQEEGGIGGTGGVGAERGSDVGSTGASEEADDEVAAGGEGLGAGAVAIVSGSRPAVRPGSAVPRCPGAVARGGAGSGWRTVSGVAPGPR